MKILVDKARFEELEAENVRLKEDAESYRKQARNLDETCKKLRKENEDLLAGIIKHTNHAGELEKERNGLQRELIIAKRANDSFMAEIKQLKAQATEAHGQFQKRVEELSTSCASAMQGVVAQKAKVEDLREERNALLARVRELEATQTDFEEATREQLDQARDHFKKQAEKMLIEIGDLKKELKALSARNAELLAERDKLLALVEEELAAAMEEHPLFASAHEGYAVLLEEVEEAEIELNALRGALGVVWSGVRHDDRVDIARAAIIAKEAAVDLAAEAIQVAAMAKKVLRSLEAVGL